MESSERFQVRHLAGGITYEYSENHNFHIFKIEDGRRSALDSWVDHVHNLLETRKVGPILLLMHDFSRLRWWELDQRFDRYTEQLFSSVPTLRRFVALVTSDANYAPILRLEYRMRELLAQREHPVHWDVFFHRRAAFAWLQSKLE